MTRRPRRNHSPAFASRTVPATGLPIRRTRACAPLS